jgi:CheY-like chemotaxis protein
MSAKTADKIKVLIVDDHPIMRVGIAAIINGRPDMVAIAQAPSCEDAGDQFDWHRPDITLMDLRFPGRSGVEAIRTIRKKHPHKFRRRNARSGRSSLLRVRNPLGQVLATIVTVPVRRPGDDAVTLMFPALAVD